jgi:hypothetical protein
MVRTQDLQSWNESSILSRNTKFYTVKLPTNSSRVTIEIIYHIPLRVMQEDIYTCGLFYSFNELGENRQISSICYAHNLVIRGMGRT